MTDDAQSLTEQCGTSVHATEALLCNLQEQKIKQFDLVEAVIIGAAEQAGRRAIRTRVTLAIR